MTARGLLAALLLAAWLPAAQSAGTPADGQAALQAFDNGTLARLKQEFAGRPFVLALWSVYCPPCREELPVLRQLQQEFPGLPVVLVAADPPADHPAVARAWRVLGMGDAPGWAFADDYLERMRWSIDPKWRGELPRSYFFDARHSAEARSGVLDQNWARAWMKRNALLQER